MELKPLWNTEYYYLLDHLGSIRVVLKEDGNVESWSDYYPFGKEARGSNTSNEPKEQFTGKERDIEIGLDYFGARYYNADIGRWTSKDPLAEKYPGLSPYNYSMNNPIVFLDPDGKYVVEAGGYTVTRVGVGSAVVQNIFGLVPGAGGLVALGIKMGWNDPSYSVNTSDIVSILVGKGISTGGKILSQFATGGKFATESFEKTIENYFKTTATVSEGSFSLESVLHLEELQTDEILFQVAENAGLGEIDRNKEKFNVNVDYFDQKTAKTRSKAINSEFSFIKNNIKKIAKENKWDLNKDKDKDKILDWFKENYNPTKDDENNE